MIEKLSDSALVWHKPLRVSHLQRIRLVEPVSFGKDYFFSHEEKNRLILFHVAIEEDPLPLNTRLFNTVFFQALRIEKEQTLE